MFDLMILMTSTGAWLAGLSALGDLWAPIVKDFYNITEPSGLKAFLLVISIDLLLAADNAIIVGALAAGLPAARRRNVIIIGVIVAMILRIAFALIFVRFMSFVGLIFLGGLLLLWVGFKMWREIRHDVHLPPPESSEIIGDDHSGLHRVKSFWGAAWAVALADVSMSLDNVLAVAGAANDHPAIIIVGLIFSVALMGIAANILAQLINRYRWLAYIGLLLLLYVALKMMVDGWLDPVVGLATLFH